MFLPIFRPVSEENRLKNTQAPPPSATLLREVAAFGCPNPNTLPPI